jgi:2'-hydroxyisoflavone reductase
MESPKLSILVLGGTAWLGRELSRQAVARGREVSCLARGESGPVAEGARLIRADRRDRAAFEQARRQEWDTVIEVGWQPGMVRGALAALSGVSHQWIYVSSASVYASHAAPGADESAEVLPPTELDEVGVELYGEAKVACELASREARDDQLLIARPGLIGGPGDRSDRAGYWVARAARDPLGPMLAPDGTAPPTQVIDVRDFASWLLDCAERSVTGTYDVVGSVVPLDEWIETSRQIGGHTGPVVRADPEWLLGEGVGEFMGEDALPLWIADPEWRGFCARTGSRAVGAGLRRRSISDTLRDTLAWERELGLDRPRKSGISPEREAELLAKLGHRPR